MTTTTPEPDHYLQTRCETTLSALYFNVAAGRLTQCEALMAEFEDPVELWVPTMAAVTGQQISAALSNAWSNGWLPADVARVVARRSGHELHSLLVTAMTLELGSYSHTHVHDVLWSQLAQLAGDHPPVEDVQTWLLLHPGGPSSGCVQAATLWHCLASLRAIEKLVPPPGQERVVPVLTDPGHVKIVTTIRTMLAKAESTPFEAEAEACVDAAQRLMTRHSIDAACFSAEQGHRDSPIGARIGVDSPHERAKALLVTVVAEANRCRAVWSAHYGFVSVVGFAVDVNLVATLYASLQSQAVAALRRHGGKAAERGETLTAEFRSSFMVAFADRVGNRLQHASAQATAAAADQRNVLPVLAAQSDVIDAAVRQWFVGLKHSEQVQASDAAGWQSGVLAAETAVIDVNHSSSGVSQAALPN